MELLKVSLLDKYVLFNDFHSTNIDKIIIPKSHLFMVYDIISEPNDDCEEYQYALRSVKITRFEIWATIGQIIILDEPSQVIARTLYGKNKYRT